MWIKPETITALIETSKLDSTQCWSPRIRMWVIKGLGWSAEVKELPQEIKKMFNIKEEK